ncbi:hypothetical protein HU200_065870 [Digitaria exilis]|uniref:Uncharacterized protein n=1 Tax=Digitaria exilis TaxID=1010633 RepID=A0A835A1Y3_9POAL|nr:hypothetical protein HU200_065870 [Digitaria exilis]
MCSVSNTASEEPLVPCSNCRFSTTDCCKPPSDGATWCITWGRGAIHVTGAYVSPEDTFNTAADAGAATAAAAGSVTKFQWPNGWEAWHGQWHASGTADSTNSDTSSNEQAGCGRCCLGAVWH